MSVNSTLITAVGRVVTAVTTRVIPTGAKVANFRIACQERNFDKTQELWVDGDRMYLRVVCWRNLADNVAASLQEGDQVVVRGRLKIRDYLTKDNLHRTDLEVDAWVIGPDLSLHTVAINRPDWRTGPHQRPPDSPPTPTTDDDDATRDQVAQAA